MAWNLGATRLSYWRRVRLPAYGMSLVAPQDLVVTPLIHIAAPVAWWDETNVPRHLPIWDGLRTDCLQKAEVAAYVKAKMRMQ